MRNEFLRTKSSAVYLLTEMFNFRQSRNFQMRIVRIAVASGVWVTGTALAQNTDTVITPPSTIALASDFGVNSHTNIHLLIPPGGLTSTPATSGPPFAGYLFQTPASVACIYGFVPSAGAPGCNPNLVTANPTGGSKTIAIVDAYDDPTAANDLAAFSAQFGLPAPNFQVVYATGTKPPQDITGGWEGEESLDIEWSHAMAPNANIVLVEAQSNSNADLFAAVKVASNLVAAASGGEVSMSWGGAEFKFERFWDSYLQTPKVVYFASAGDSAGVEYPSASPFVVAAGGTALSMNLYTGNFQLQLAWLNTGGGPSAYEPQPSYQSVLLQGLTTRAVPDISFDADPDTGVWVYDSTPWYADGEVFGGPKHPWLIVGGTSVAAPSLAGVVNTAGSFAPSTNAELTTIYSSASTGFTDVTYGVCGFYDGFIAGPGYDFCTGLGSPYGYGGK
jgi:kumamolisin